MDFPGGSVVQTLQGAQIPFLVGELRSHMLLNMAGKKKKKKNKDKENSQTKSRDLL